jgi:hypothetical protein
LNVIDGFEVSDVRLPLMWAAMSLVGVQIAAGHHQGELESDFSDAFC